MKAFGRNGGSGGEKVCFVYSNNCSSLDGKQVFMVKSRWHISGKPLKNLVSGKVFSEARCSPWSVTGCCRNIGCTLIHPAAKFNLQTYVACIVILGMWPWTLCVSFFSLTKIFILFFPCCVYTCPQRSVGSYLWDLLSFLVVYFLSHFSSSLMVLDANIDTN